MLLWSCLKYLATLAVQAAHTVQCINLLIALYLSCILYYTIDNEYNMT